MVDAAVSGVSTTAGPGASSNDVRGGAPVIRAVLFDFDGVLTTDPTGSYTTVAALARSTGIEPERISNALAPFNADLLHGRTTHASIWPMFCAALGQDVPFALLDDAFANTPMDVAMLELARRLQSHCRLGIVTDNWRDRIVHLVRRHALAQLFDPIVVSAECGSGKYDTAIFERTLARLDMPGDAVVFIDNSARNLVAPAALGIHTIFFDDAQRDVAGLASTLEERFGLSF